jgi:hypothetical protein
MSEGFLADPVGSYISDPPNKLVLTFNNLIKRTPFVKIIGAMVAQLERAYGRPVDTEFTASVDAGGRIRVNLLQCRPLFMPGATASVSGLTYLPGEQVLFKTRRMMGGGEARDIRYILYIDPQRYSAIADLGVKKSIGRIVGRLNEHPQIVNGKILMMGPGRWGSSTPSLGIPISFVEICNASVLVEVAQEEGGLMPELSFGTHFFQDLVETKIFYVALFPSKEGVVLNTGKLNEMENEFTNYLPDYGKWESVIQVYDLSKLDKELWLDADFKNQTTKCFFC